MSCLCTNQEGKQCPGDWSVESLLLGRLQVCLHPAPQSQGMRQLDMVSTNPGKPEWLLSPTLCWDQCPRVQHLGAISSSGRGAHRLWHQAMSDPGCLCSQRWGGPQWHLHCPGPAAAADEAGEGRGRVWCCLHLADEPLPDDSDAGKASAPPPPGPLLHDIKAAWVGRRVSWPGSPSTPRLVPSLTLCLSATQSSSSAAVEIAQLWASPGALFPA